MPLVLSLPSLLFSFILLYSEQPATSPSLPMMLSLSFCDPISPSVPQLSLVTLHQPATTGHTDLPRVKGNGVLLAVSIHSLTVSPRFKSISDPLNELLITSHPSLLLSLH